MESEKETTDVSIEADLKGVGAGGKGKNKSSAKRNEGSSSASTTKTNLTPNDEFWPKDLPSTYTKCMKNCNDILRPAMHQGPWIGLARYLEALYVRRGVSVKLSPQHLVNNIKNKDTKTGRITKYNEIKKFLMEEGLVREESCPFTGLHKDICPKSCENSDGPRFKIQDLIYTKTKDVNEEDVIKIINEGLPVLAVIDAYQSFDDYKDGIYEGKTDRKDRHFGRHVILVSGYASTPDGVLG